MEQPSHLLIRSSFLFLTIYLLCLHISEVSSLSPFSPIDQYLVDCGSAAPTTEDPFNRKFRGDESSLHNSFLLSAARTISVSDSIPPETSSSIYQTTRIFTTPSKYVFPIRSKGIHFVRLHFNRFNSSDFDLLDAQFHVLAGGYLLLNNFSGLTVKTSLIREYLFWVDSDQFSIWFVPLKKSKFAFINAIEVFSAPKDLILDIARFVNSDGAVELNGLSRNAFETMYRINVGGPKVTPFNDSMWRTWIPDDQYLKSSDGSRRIYFSGRIGYRRGGASREVAPDNVYNTARVIRSENAIVPKLNLTWAFPVDEGYKYLVRTHFCDIASAALFLLYFNVYVNGHLAYENLDLSLTTGFLASPFYADFVVDGGSSRFLTVGIGPSNLSYPHAIDGILNGVEIMKMNNLMHSLDGEVSPASIFNRCSLDSVRILVPLVAAACLLVAASMALKRKIFCSRNSLPWSPLPQEVSEVSLKSADQQFAGMLRSA